MSNFVHFLLKLSDFSIEILKGISYSNKEVRISMLERFQKLKNYFE